MLALLLALASGRDTLADNGEKPPAAETAGAIVTLWPLFDYRSSPATGYSNLSILGPLFKRETSKTGTVTALRPFFFNNATPGSEDTDILYPFASTARSDTYSETQVIKLYQKHVSREGTADEKRDAMLFPFYISGHSDKYGPYRSYFPFYGHIYERFWKDEYHFLAFPLYGRTVKHGTTSTNYLYPFFNTVSGENESGFQFWPLYGQAAKTGVYDRRFALWPFFLSEQLGQDTDNPTRNLALLPFYFSSDSPKRSATYAPWPFCGVVRDGSGQVMERDYFWPLWLTAQGKDSSTERFIPFYSKSTTKETSSRWLMWPLYHHENLESPQLRLEKTSLLYFLFRKSDEAWPQTGKSRSSSAMWPLYTWKRDENGMRTLSLPALVEPVIWSDGVERNWAPLWRIFISRWDDKGNGAVSFLWNLFWYESRGSEHAGELSPLLSWRSTNGGSSLRLLKGLFGYDSTAQGTSLSIFWIPFGGGGK